MSSAPKETSSKPKHVDIISRGIKKPNTPGLLTFVGLRVLEPFLQYGILANGVGASLVHSIGLETLPAGPPNTGTPLDALGLSPYRLVLFGMAVGEAAKQIFWVTQINEEEFPPSTAATVAVFNGVFNSLNSLLFTTTVTSASLSSGGRFPQVPLVVGAVLFTAGLAIEAAAEVQRKRFKRDAKNKGKLYTGGLWKFTRHANYLGYTLWRTGYALAAGGWYWAAFSAAFPISDFVTRGIPAIEEYTSKKYGAQWQEYTKKTPYKLIPYIY